MISNSSENISVDTMDNATLNRRKDYKEPDIFVSVHIRIGHFPNLMEKKTPIGLVFLLYSGNGVSRSESCV